MATPRFELDPDGQHVWWFHQCATRPDGWPEAAGHLPITETAQAMLPQGKIYWTVTQREPLTVVPSILCMECGCHGFITNGQWIPA